MRSTGWGALRTYSSLSLSLARSLAHSLTLTLMMELHLSRSFFSRSTSSASLIAAEGAASAERQLCAARERAAGEERPADDLDYSRGASAGSATLRVDPWVPPPRSKRPWAGQSRGRECNPASCVGCAPRRACERRAAAACRQVALAAAKFARLWILDWTLVS